MKPVIALTILAVLFGAPLIAEEGKSDPPVAKTHKLSVKAAGPPVPAFRYELVPSFRNQTHGNAALLYHRAMLLMADVRPPKIEGNEAEERIREAMELPTKDLPREEIRRYLKQYANVFKEVEAGVLCDHCDWGVNGRIAAEGASFLIPEISRLRNLGYLLSVRCRLHMADGRLDLVLRDIQSGLALGRHAAHGPSLIHFLVGTAITGITLGEFEKVIQLPDCPNLYWSLTALPRPFVDMKPSIEGELRGLEATVPFPKGIEDTPMSPDQAMAAIDRLRETLMALSGGQAPDPATFRLGAAAFVALKHQSARSAQLAAGKSVSSLEAMPPAQVVLLDALVRYRDLRDEHFVWMSSPFPEAVAGLRRVEEKFEAMKGDKTDLTVVLMASLVPARKILFDANIRTERKIAALRTVELVRWHAAKNGGALPDKLSDITAAVVPLDLVTGRSFAYKSSGASFTVTVATPPGEKPTPSNNSAYEITLVK